MGEFEMQRHAKKAAKKIVAALLDDLNGRRGFDFNYLETEIQDEIRNEWIKLTAEVIFNEGLTR